MVVLLYERLKIEAITYLILINYFFLMGFIVFNILVFSELIDLKDSNL